MNYRVYWQPGCTSCLRTKEFLSSHGIEFESINVREDPAAMAALEALGVRSVPVVARGTDYVFAQELRDVARFVGVALDNAPFSPADLMQRLDRILAAAERYVCQLPADCLLNKLPGRDRTYLDLAYHLFVIPTAFLDAAHGGELTEEHFDRKPPADMHTVEGVATFGQSVRDDLQQWWHATADKDLPGKLNTYYGRQPAQQVLERTCWHTAQHARQLMAVLDQLGIEPDGALGAAELEGLPLPEKVWDAEIALTQ